MSKHSQEESVKDETTVPADTVEDDAADKADEPTETADEASESA